MSPKSTKTVLLDFLEDLSQDDFKKFVEKLLDRKSEPRVRRSKVDGKDRLDVVNVLVSTFTEAGAVSVTEEILKNIDRADLAQSLAEETKRQSSTCASHDTPGASAGAAGGTMGGGKHFVDEHRLELINRVSNIAPILDELLFKDVIQQEAYDTIRAMSTNQEKMRALYGGPLKAGVACKDIFYEILKTHEKYLISDLMGQ